MSPAVKGSLVLTCDSVSVWSSLDGWLGSLSKGEPVTVLEKASNPELHYLVLTRFGLGYAVLIEGDTWVKDP